MSKFDYKNELQKSYEKFKANNECEPNAVWVDIEMKDPDGYDTPFFCGYVLLISDEEIDECVDYACIFTTPNGDPISELDIVFYTNSIEDFVQDIEDEDTYFNVVGVGEFSLLPKK